MRIALIMFCTYLLIGECGSRKEKTMKNRLFLMSAILLGSSLTITQNGLAHTETQVVPQVSSEQSIIDLKILSQIQSKFDQDPLLSTSEIVVFSNAGNITLDGLVPNSQAENEAVKLAKEVSGVKSVTDALLVTPMLQVPAGGSQLTSDPAILTEIQSRMAHDPTLTHAKIQVFSEAGNVILNGFVPSFQAEHQALTVARQVPGVKSVRDNLMVSPDISMQVFPGYQRYSRVGPIWGPGNGIADVVVRTRQGVFSTP
jgi:osmotically-inducible protein OsmY